jgi:hypothetical protein
MQSIESKAFLGETETIGGKFGDHHQHWMKEKNEDHLHLISFIALNCNNKSEFTGTLEIISTSLQLKKRQICQLQGRHIKSQTTRKASRRII